MKGNLKKYIAILVAVIFVVGVSVYWFSRKNKTVQTSIKVEDKKTQDKDTKNKTASSASKSNQEKGANANSQNSKTASKSAKGAAGKSGGSTTASGANPNKINLNGPTLSSVKQNQGVYISAKKARFGSLVEVYINDKNIDTNKVKFYQVVSKDKAISKMVDVSKETTIYPDQNRGDKVKVRLFGQDKKIITTVDATVVQNK